MARILIFGGGLQAISVARSLKECGHYILLAAKNDKVAQKSNYIDEFLNIEDDRDASKVLNILKPIISEYNIEIVFPMEDAQAESLSQCKEALENGKVKCAVMDWKVFKWVSDKTQLLSFCKQYDFPHPKTVKLLDGNLDEASCYVGFPALIKPDHSEGAKGITLVNSIEDLRNQLPSVVEKYGQCSLQEYISKKDYYYNVMLYRGLDGSFGNHCIIKILRYYPIGGGSSSLCVTINNDALLKLCSDVLEKIDWHGFADFDILEKDDGDYRIIEINPRVPASLRAAAISGINFPEQIVSDLLKGEYPLYDYKPGKYLRYLGLDIAWFLSSPRRWSSRPSWFKFIGRNIHYQEGGIKDLRAMLTSIVEGVKKQLNPEFRKEKGGINNLKK